MSKASNGIDAYVDELATYLGALGSAEAQDVTTEMRDHLEQAVAEADGDFERVLGEFGSPQALAERILEERGLLSAPAKLSPAPSWRVALAFAVDVLMTLVAALFICVPVLAIAVPFGQSWTGYYLRLAIAVAIIVAGLAWGIRWWVRRQRNPEHSSTGMDLLGIRRLRAGSRLMLVMVTDIPGAVPPRRGWAIARVALASVIFLPMVATLLNPASQPDWVAQNAVSNTSVAASTATGLYADVLNGATAGDLRQNYGGDIADQIERLVKLREVGQLTSYMVQQVELPSDQIEPKNPSEMDVTAFVTIAEWHKGSDVPVSIRYRVQSITVDESTTSGPGWSTTSGASEWRITGAEQI